MIHQQHIIWTVGGYSVSIFRTAERIWRYWGKDEQDIPGFLLASFVNSLTFLGRLEG